MYVEKVNFIADRDVVLGYEDVARPYVERIVGDLAIPLVDVGVERAVQRTVLIFILPDLHHLRVKRKKEDKV
ncbi:hypothetical protein [Shouchella shacheensis]|uniref:hypothetical protein n=1 Tax=Shouchella shacheensis TaxID=1649580 RepID=UPI0007401BB5|nr:hypothetical protein [Shouchella shacheensis]